MNRLIPALAAALFCLASGVSHAQDANKAPGGPHYRGKPCSQEADAAKCEANRKDMMARAQAAREVCKDKPDRRACMTEQFCAKSEDPSKCQAMSKQRQENVSKRMDARQAAAEACTGKRGDELQKCLHSQRASDKK